MCNYYFHSNINTPYESYIIRNKAHQIYAKYKSGRIAEKVSERQVRPF